MIQNPATPFNLYLIRHGQSHANTTPDFIGQKGETPLTELGQEQSKLLGKRLTKDIGWPDRVYASNYLRAKHTAELATINLQPKMLAGWDGKIVIVPELREYSAGDWSGLSRKLLHNTEIKLDMSYRGNGFLPPNGESMTMVERRVSQWVEEEILYNQSLEPNANILVFSHGMTIRCLLHYVMGFDQNFTWRIEIDNTSITKLSFSEYGWRLEYLNNTSHLPESRK